MRIQIIGIGCNACRQMEAEVRAVVAEWRLDAEVERVVDLEQILNYRLTVLPGLAVDGQVISMGYGGRRRIERALREWSEGQFP
jgi:small redox-active disulfide protein 2